MRRFGKILLGLFAVLAAMFLVFRTPDTDPVKMRLKYGAPPSQFIEIDEGQTIHLRDEGPRGAPAIILIHGSNADLHTWQPWADGLKEEYRVIRFDQRGHGLTGPAPDEDYTLAAYVEDVEGLVTRLGLQRFVLGGNSMGGTVAMAYAMKHPDQTAGLVLIDAGGGPVVGAGGGNVGFTIAAMPGINLLVEQITPRRLVEKSLLQSVSNQSVVTSQMVDRYWELLRYPGNRRATLVRFGIDRPSFLEAAIMRVFVPTLVMWGEDDQLVPLDAGRWYARNLPNSTLVTYPNIGHLPHEETAQQSLSDLRDWLVTLGLGKSIAEPSETKSVEAKSAMSR